jgi:hypothetical protein
LRRSTNLAIAELKSAAAKGNTDAMQLLGEMNRDGLGGVQKNATFAQQWFDYKPATLQRQAQAQAQANAELAAQQAAEAEQANEAPAPRAQTSVFGAIVNALGNATANADPNAIQNTTNQQINNIQAAQARAQAAQAKSAASTAQQGGNAAGTNRDCPTPAQMAANPTLTCLAR